jgi:DNA mismatch endonuclease (patch repair protein)
MHNCKYGRVKPATNASFWRAKRTSNKLRDRTNITALKKLGWDVLIIWECWTKDPSRLTPRLHTFLNSRPVAS